MTILNMKNKKIYLASSYTNEDHEDAFLKACHAAAILIRCGAIVFSPIAHSHYIAKFSNLPKDVTFWRTQNHAFLDWCDELWVLETNNYKSSKGVAAEMAYIKRAGKPIHFIAREEG